ncbi:hypothetical protein H4J50_17945 [Colwellia sp. 6M3]|jgi:hypothetical protein|uniref:hypothetical protein n=1 Tax=Colwellia sp. 6M3 TaxID=2759849 RepID=UPI0015F54C00|nr:hypothetical protein [Colwellia sp. 6M3]MBA6417880.1 hypothetical protein [Colwellia sp. 6M3]|tara:strand:- start:8001 stop:8387 length:387 start_codon:yes stop_codon:yes gene_type:complete
MYYPKFIYENLPYAYFLVCAYLLAFYDSWPVFVSVGLLYCAGCITLVTRSEYRRVDRRKSDDDNFIKKNKLPEWIYEYLPYGYFAVAMVIVLKTTSSALQFIAFCLMILALRNLLFRMNNRRKAKSLF